MADLLSTAATPQQIAEDVMSGWAWDGMPADQLAAVRHFAQRAIEADRAQRNAHTVEAIDDKAEAIALLIRNEFYLPDARVEEMSEGEREVLLPIALSALTAALGGDE